MSDNGAPLRSANEFSSVCEARACFVMYCSSQTEVMGPSVSPKGALMSRASCILPFYWVQWRCKDSITLWILVSGYFLGNVSIYILNVFFYWYHI